MDYKFSKRSKDTLKTVDGRLQALVYAVLDNSPYDFGIPSTGGIRTAEEQNELFKKGWSKLDGYNKCEIKKFVFCASVLLRP